MSASGKPIAARRGIYDDQVVKDLIKTKPMLAGMDRLIYEHIRDAIKDANTKIPEHNPYLYETLLSDVAKCLDRCIAYRREAADLEAQAVRRALEFKLFTDLAANEDAMRNLVTSTEALTKQKEASESAEAKFGPGAIEAGFKALYGQTAQSYRAAIDVENDKRDKLEKRLASVREYQTRLEERHTTPGHSLNFIERRKRLIALLLQDIVEAYQKAKAAQAGLEYQLSIKADPKFPFPAIYDDERDAQFLDAFVLWARSVAQQYEASCAQDVSFVRVIPLVAPLEYVPGGTSLISTATFTAAMAGDGKLRFSLKNAIPGQLEQVRLRGIGVSMGLNHGNPYQPNEGHWLSGFSWSVFIFPPAEYDPLRSTPKQPVQIMRSPSILGKAPINRSDTTPDLAVGEHVWNIDPRAGDWQIRVEPLVNWVRHEPDGPIRHNDQLRDIKLHLLLTARPKNDVGAWDKSAVDPYRKRS